MQSPLAPNSAMGYTSETWKVLVVDDEPDIHDVTTMVFKRFRLDDVPLELLHANSGAEARVVLEQHSDIAVILLDVVMETETSGLDLVVWCRESLKNHRVRIVLRTGQPGQAPEQQVIVDYDINDYREKTELDRKRLFTLMYNALRGYRDIMTVETERQLQVRYRVGLERVLTATNKLFSHRRPTEFANGLLQQVMAVLRLQEKGALVQARGVSVIHHENDEKEFEVLASVGPSQPDNAVDPDLIAAVQRAHLAKASQVEGDIFVGYYASNSGKSVMLALRGAGQIDAIDLQLLQVFASAVSIAFDNIVLSQEVLDTQGELIHRLGDVVESRSHEAGSHVKRMSEVSHLLGLAYGLSVDEAEILRRAAPMHDIGKIATPDAVLLKPGKLDEAEWAVMRQHPSVGYTILDGSQRPIIAAAAIIAHQHHERIDGKGYPQGLKGDDIHIYARIIAVADVFDALTHSRCYKPAWTVEDAITQMQASCGTHLDSKLVQLLIDNLDEARAINDSYPA